MIDKQKLLSFVADQMVLTNSLVSTDTFKYIEMKIKGGEFDTEYNIVDHLPSILKRIQDDILSLEEKVRLSTEITKKVEKIIESKGQASYFKKKITDLIDSVDTIELFLDERFDEAFSEYKDDRDNYNDY
jgi:hypothetical protein